jgi:hypothetical protein
MVVPLGAMQTDPLRELLHRGVAAVADAYIGSQFELSTQKNTQEKTPGLSPAFISFQQDRITLELLLDRAVEEALDRIRRQRVVPLVSAIAVNHKPADRVFPHRTGVTLT